MAEEKKQGAPNALAKYGEKIALGVSLAALGAGAIVMFAFEGADPAAPARTAAQKLKAEFTREHEDRKAPAPENWQAQSVGDWNTVLASARPGDNWVATLPTAAEGLGEKVAIRKEKVYKVPEVLMGQVDVQIDHILVSWSVKDFTREEKLKGAKDYDYGALSHFKLERQAKGGAWEVLDPKIDAKTLSYKDTKIDPKTPYTYRITAYSADKGYLERGTPDETVGARPNVSGQANQQVSAQVQTYGLWKLSFANPFKPAEGKGKVYVTIEKFEKGVGKVMIKRIHDEGDSIGTWPEAEGAEPTSKHKVSVPPGRVLEVDWSTGATLVKVEPKRVTVDVKKCKAILGNMGKMGCEEVTERRPVSTNLIVVKDADGTQEIYSPALPDTNERCEEHGGRPKASAPGSASSAPGTPAVDPKAALKQKKEDEAAALFQKADEALEKQNKPLARSLYEKLLKDYKETDFVANQKKAVIEERLGALK